ncbi:MAG: hypothetical protein OXK20_09835 [Deltaproteobacteria bacterium]|nr:hypothetical protein [Deltaproteobacteria bacterium]
MTCDDFRQWLETAGAGQPEKIPDAHREHAESCAACRGILEEEQRWLRFFAVAPETSPRRPVWPGVMARIREEESRRASLSDALLFFSRRLAPAFALVVLLLGGVGLWSDMLPETREQVPATVAMLENGQGQEALSGDEPDAVLIAWVGARVP